MTFIQALIGFAVVIAGAIIITDICNILFSNEVALVVSLLLSFAWGYGGFALIIKFWNYFNDRRHKKINIWK
jgi:hypothetical protein